VRLVVEIERIGHELLVVDVEHRLGTPVATEAIAAAVSATSTVTSAALLRTSAAVAAAFRPTFPTVTRVTWRTISSWLLLLLFWFLSGF
jgi:hypothetical protein